MSSAVAGWLQFALLLAACNVPLGNYIARIFTDKKHLRVERRISKRAGSTPKRHALERRLKAADPGGTC